jgi:hypothetical protein
MTIIDVRGTHGSGKSWVMHSLMEQGDPTPIIEDGNHLGYLLQKWDAALVGKYSNVCGGCDGVKTADEVCRRVREFSQTCRHVLLEGILVSHTYSRYDALAKELGDYIFCFLNTPLHRCIRRVKSRRLKAGNTKPFNPKNLTSDWHQIWGRVRIKMQNEHHQVMVLNHKDPLPKILEILDGNL